MCDVILIDMHFVYNSPTLIFDVIISYFLLVNWFSECKL